MINFMIVPSATDNSVPRETWPLEENASTAPKDVEKEVEVDGER